jgi:hypothetical protein
VPPPQELAKGPSIHGRCTAAYLLGYAHEVADGRQLALLRQLLLHLLADGSMVVRGAAATQLRLLTWLAPEGEGVGVDGAALAHVAAARELPAAPARLLACPRHTHTPTSCPRCTRCPRCGSVPRCSLSCCPPAAAPPLPRRPPAPLSTRPPAPAAVAAHPGTGETTTACTHLAQLLVLATHHMMPPGAQLQMWKQLRPAFLAALALEQPDDEEDYVLLQRVALAQLERLAPHLPQQELLAVCKVRPPPTSPPRYAPSPRCLPRRSRQATASGGPAGWARLVRWAAA